WSTDWRTSSSSSRMPQRATKTSSGCTRASRSPNAARTGSASCRIASSCTAEHISPPVAQKSSCGRRSTPRSSTRSPTSTASTTRSCTSWGGHEHSGIRPRRRGGADLGASGAVGARRLGRPGEPHELRGARLPHLLRLLAGEGHPPHARRPPRRACHRRHRPAGDDGSACPGDARVRTVGDRAEGPAVTAAPLHLSLAIIEGRHLLGLVDEFIALLDGPRDPADGGLNRLAPDPYPDDAEASAEYRRSTRDDLFDQRLADALDVRTTLEDFDGTLGDAQDVMLSRTVTIQPDRVNGWLR